MRLLSPPILRFGSLGVAFLITKLILPHDSTTGWVIAFGLNSAALLGIVEVVAARQVRQTAKLIPSRCDQSVPWSWVSRAAGLALAWALSLSAIQAWMQSSPPHSTLRVLLFVVCCVPFVAGIARTRPRISTMLQVGTYICLGVLADYVGFISAGDGGLVAAAFGPAGYGLGQLLRAADA